MCSCYCTDTVWLRDDVYTRHLYLDSESCVLLRTVIFLWVLNNLRTVLYTSSIRLYAAFLRVQTVDEVSIKSADWQYLLYYVVLCFFYWNDRLVLVDPYKCVKFFLHFLAVIITPESATAPTLDLEYGIPLSFLPEITFCLFITWINYPQVVDKFWQNFWRVGLVTTK